MAKYDKPTWQLMQDMADALLSSPEAVISKDQVHEWFRTKYPLLKRGTIDAHLSRMSTNVPVRVHYGVKRPGPDDLLYRIDTKLFRRYNQQSDPAPIYELGETSLPVSTAEVEEDAIPIGPGETEFAYESDLRDYLARNLSLVEGGLTLYRDEGITGIEFPVGGRFIDILAVDSSGAFVVLELKVSRGYDRVVGQLLRYVGWIRANLAEEGQQVRGVIIARDITADLRIACAEAKNVELFEYELSLTLTKVS